MDLFTHVLFAYLAIYGTFGPTATNYIIAGAVAGGLPDGDALFWPISKRFPILRHHGITHSIFGVTLIAVVGGWFIVPYFLSGSPYLFVLVMEIGGLSHVFLDGFTNFSVPPFLPFSEKAFHLDADLAVNFGTMMVTLASYVLLAEERGRVALAVWETTAWALVAIYLGYLIVRGLGRYRAGAWKEREGFLEVLPTGNPFRFLLVDETEDAAGFYARNRSYWLGRGAHGTTHTLRVERRSDLAPGPVQSESDALTRSLPFSKRESRWRFDTYRFAEVTRRDAGYEVFWYSLEFQTLGRAAGIIAQVDEHTGSVAAKSAWRRPTL